MSVWFAPYATRSSNIPSAPPLTLDRFPTPIYMAMYLRSSCCVVILLLLRFGGLRPFGVSFLIAGWDEHFGFQLFQSDPSGNYGGWKATAIGANNQAAQSILKQDYKDDITMASSLKLAIKVLSKSMDSTTLSRSVTTLHEPPPCINACRHPLRTSNSRLAATRLNLFPSRDMATQSSFKCCRMPRWMPPSPTLGSQPLLWAETLKQMAARAT